MPRRDRHSVDQARLPVHIQDLIIIIQLKHLIHYIFVEDGEVLNLSVLMQFLLVYLLVVCLELLNKKLDNYLHELILAITVNAYLSELLNTRAQEESLSI